MVSDWDMDNSISSDEELETIVPETKIREWRVSSCKFSKSGEGRVGKESLDKVHLNCSSVFWVHLFYTIEAYLMN